MKKIFILSLLALNTNIFANELINYAEIKSAITEGKSIRIAVDFDKCELTAGSFNKLQSFGLGIFSPNEIAIDNGHIAASLLHFTMSDPHMPNKPIYQFLKYIITQDNMINLTTKSLDAVNFTPLSNGFTFNCKINTAAKVYS